MGFVSGLFEQRSFNPSSTLRDPAGWFRNWLTNWGEGDDEAPTSPKAALGVPAWFACIRNISEDCAKLPLKVFRPKKPRGAEPLIDHPAYRLLHDEWNSETSAMVGRETLFAHALGWSGGYAQIERHPGTGEPIALHNLDPRTTAPVRADDGVLYYRSGNVIFRASDVLHLHGLGYDGITGYMLARVMRDTLRQAKGAQQFSSAWFANGAQPSLVMKLAQKLTPEAFEELRKRLEARYSGSGKAGRMMLLQPGLDVEPISSTSPVDSQLLETLLYSVVDVCRIFRMPPHKIQHLNHATFSNISAQSVEYVTDTLLSHVTRFEQECNRKLLGARDKEAGVYCRHNMRALLRGDLAQQAQHYKEGLQNGYFSIDDVREFEDLNPLEGLGGDTYWVQGNMVPVELAVERRVSQEAGMVSSTGQAGQGDVVREANRALLESALHKSVRILGDKYVRAQKRVRQTEWWAQCVREHVDCAYALVQPILAAHARVYAKVVIGRVFGADLEPLVNESAKDAVRGHVMAVAGALEGGLEHSVRDEAIVALYAIERAVADALGGGKEAA